MFWISFQYTPVCCATPSILENSPYFTDVKMNVATVAVLIYSGKFWSGSWIHYNSFTYIMMTIILLLILTNISIFSLLPANGACGWCNRGVSSDGNSFNISYGNFDRFHPLILDTLMLIFASVWCSNLKILNCRSPIL